MCIVVILAYLKCYYHFIGCLLLALLVEWGCDMGSLEYEFIVFTPRRCGWWNNQIRATANIFITTLTLLGICHLGNKMYFDQVVFLLS